MILIYDDKEEVFENWYHGEGLLLLPDQSISPFIVKNLHKYSILKADDRILRMIDSDKKNISINELDDLFKEEAYFDIYTKPNRGQLDQLFKKTVDNITQNIDVYCTIDAFVLFIEWAKDNYKEFEEEVYYSGDNENIINGYGKAKVKQITLNNLDKLLKLFCLFYGRTIPSRDIQFISNFQRKLSSLDLTFFKELHETIKIVDKKFDESREKLPPNNIFNKILEMLENLERLDNNFEVNKELKLNVLIPKKELMNQYSNDFRKMLEE